MQQCQEACLTEVPHAVTEAQPRGKLRREVHHSLASGYSFQRRQRVASCGLACGLLGTAAWAGLPPDPLHTSGADHLRRPLPQCEVGTSLGWRSQPKCWAKLMQSL